MYCNNDKNDWDDHLDSILFAFRTATSTATGMTPFETMFGRRSQSGIEFLYKTTEEDLKEEQKHHIHTTKDMKRIHEQILRNQRKMIEANRRARDRRRINISFEPGDVILHYDVGYDKRGTTKFQWRYSGPHKIIRRSPYNKLVYIFEDAVTKKHRTTHVNRLIKYDQYQPDANVDGCWHPIMFNEPQKETTSTFDMDQHALKKGDMVIVQYEPGSPHHTPFAVGEIIRVDKKADKLTLWWYGNNNNNIYAAQRTGYWQASINKYYYKDTPDHKNHPRYTSNTTESDISLTHILTKPFQLGYEQNIPFPILRHISDDSRVPWSMDKKTEGLTDVLTALR
jgi:hypothetical protein